MRATLLALTLVAVPGLAGAATITRYGQLPANETWDSSNTYQVTGDLTVPAGVTLTINTGTDVTVASTDSQASGTDTGRVEIIVNGTLIVNGAQIHGASSGNSHWYGIEVNAGGQATISGADIWDGRTLITNAGTTSITGSQLGNTVSGYSNTGSLTIDSTSMVNGSTGGYGLYTYGGSVVVKNGSLIQGFSAGHGIAQGGGTLAVDHTVLNGNGSTSGYYNVYIYGGTSTTFDHVDILNGAYYGWYSSVNASLTNSIVSGHTSYYGVYRAGGTLTQNHNDVWSNGTNYGSVSPDSTSFSANPLFVSGSDFHLQSNSPCRKADSNGAESGALTYSGVNTTALEGFLYQNTTLASSTTMSGDVTVPAGVTLTIPAGVTITAASTDDMASGVDTGRVEIVVYGTLVVNGNISGASAGNSHWYGIEVKSGGTANISGAGIWDGRTLITNDGTTSITGSQLGNTVSGYSNTGSLTIDSTSMVNGSTGGYGLYTYGGTVIVKNGSVIQGFSAGHGIAQGGGSLAVDHTILNNNGSTSGYYNVYIYGGTSTTFDHVDILNGAYYGWYSSVNATLTNSIMSGHASYYGVYRAGGTLTQNHNDVWSNGTNYGSVSPDATSFSANPLFVSGSDFHLQSNSPCRKADNNGAYVGAMDFNGTNTTALQGFLYQSTTLASSTSMTGDVTVPAGVTLTIPTGVTVTTASTDAMASGVDTGRVELIVYGTLIVNGNIYGSSAGNSHWYGIEVKSGGQATLSGAGIYDTRTVLTNDGTSVVTGSQLGNTVSGYSNTGSLTIDSTSMVNGSTGGYGLYTYGGSVIVRNGSSIQNFAAGHGIAQGGGTLAVDHTVLNNNGSTSGYYNVYVYGGTGTTFDHVDILNGAYYGWYSSVNATLTNSIVSGHTSYYGVYRAGGTLTQNHNDVWSNGTNYGSVSPDSTSISSNPDFVSASDFHLQPVSPCRGAGSSGSDMGAYPYQTGAVDHVVVSPGTATVTAGGTQAFTATAYDANNQPISGVNFTWTATSAAGSISTAGTLTASCTPATLTAAVTATVGNISGSANLTITTGAVSTVAVSPSSASVAAGASRTFTASAHDSCGNAVSPTFAWSTGVNAGSITSAGVYTAPCTAGSYPSAITATAGGVSAHADVTVTAAALASLSVSPSTASLPSGTTQQFTATGADSCGNPMSASATWSVVNGGGSIDSTGLFTAGNQAGTFANTVKASANGLSATASVSVTAGSIASLTISPTTVTLAQGATQQFTATARDSGGNPVSISPTWSVLHGGGSITAGGLFTAGTTAGTFSGTVQVSASGYTATADVVVLPGATTLVLVSPTQTTLAPAGTQLFHASTYDSAGNATADAVSWSVASSSAGSITQSGVFTAGSSAGSYPGAVVATANGIHGTADVTVSQAALSQLTVQPGSASVAVGGQVAFTAQGLDANGNSVGVTPTWSVVHGGGTIDASSGIFTAGTAPGTYAGTIQASARGLSATATVVVTVGPVVTVSISPSHPTVNAGATASFTANAADAYGNAVTGAATTWAANPAAGTIDASGTFTAANTAGDFASAITATVQGIQGTASVQILGGTSSSSSGSTGSSGTTSSSGSTGSGGSGSTGGTSGGSTDGSSSGSGTSGATGNGSNVSAKGSGCGAAGSSGLELGALALALLALGRRRR